MALECLLKDDHVFQYDQLSTAILRKESHIIGLLQLSEDSENVRPAVMVSFIHKSIQEFLAALYITYQCIPEGNLGEMIDRARTWSEFLSLLNVFQFVCGLSDKGAVKVLEHLTSLRISDPELDLSRIIPDEQSETIVTFRPATGEQKYFFGVVHNSFKEVRSKIELWRRYLNCTVGIIYASPGRRSISDIVPERKIFDEVLVRGVVWDDCGYDCKFDGKATKLSELLEFFYFLHIPPKITENSVFSAGEFVKKFEAVKCDKCSLCCTFHFHRDQFRFYITKLQLWCDDHARLFKENCTPSHPASLCPELSFPEIS